MTRTLKTITVVVESEAWDFFNRNFIKISPFLQQKMREVLPIVLKQKLEAEQKL